MKHTTLFFLLTLFSQILFADTPTSIQLDNREFPPEELQKQKEHIAQMVAQEIAKSLPQKVDKYTRLVAIKSDKALLVYTFELNVPSKSDDEIIKEDHSRMQRAITKGVCQSSKKFLSAGINTRYIYKSAKSNKELFRFDITRDRCKL